MIAVTVTQLASHIKMVLGSDLLLNDVWISGEISNLSKPASGHCYFTLKDESAQLRCALFKQRANVAAVAALQFGAQVLAHGHISLYEQRGDLQLYVDAVQPEGIGVLQAELERLMVKLDEEGLFAVERKRPLPAFPRRIGLVTSASGAVFHDICHVAGRRWPAVEIVLAPTLVQGDGAAAGIVAAIERLNRQSDIDVIVLARGGGSLEDLWAFNGESVARAIFASRIPIVSAIGHETDYTIADYVADVRAPTPSAAAEIVVPDQVEIAMRVGSLAQTLAAYAQHALSTRRASLAASREALDRCRPQPAGLAAGVLLLAQRMERRLGHEIDLWHERIDGRTQQLAALSPLATLGRGYALVQASDGRVLTQAAEAKVGDRLRIRLSDGAIKARVEAGAGASRPTKSQPAEMQQSRLL